VQAPAKTTVDKIMRLDIPEIQQIYSKVMVDCKSNPTCMLPRVQNYHVYGVLSTDVHLLPDELYIRDDEPQAFREFFQCLAEMYKVSSEMLDSDEILTFEAGE